MYNYYYRPTAGKKSKPKVKNNTNIAPSTAPNIAPIVQYALEIWRLLSSNCFKIQYTIIIMLKYSFENEMD